MKKIDALALAHSLWLWQGNILFIYILPHGVGKNKSFFNAFGRLRTIQNYAIMEAYKMEV